MMPTYKRRTTPATNCLNRVLLPAMQKKRLSKSALQKKLGLTTWQMDCLWEMKENPSDSVIRKTSKILDLNFEMLYRIATYRPDCPPPKREGFRRW